MSDKEDYVARGYDKNGPTGMSASVGQDDNNDFPKKYKIPKREKRK